jgi:diguanylate cyclase (GGDEF)-like protein
MGTALKIGSDDWKSWLRALNQGSTYLGLAMIGLIWLGLDFHLQSERATVQEDALQNAANLSRAFEEHLVRTLKDADHSLQIVRNAYERNPRVFDLANWSREEHALEGPAFQIAIIGPDGLGRATTGASAPSPVDFSDREHFRVHLDTQDDNLFISKPIIGRVTGKPAVLLSRRIRNADGSFGGVVVISLDPTHFTRFYDSINIGRDGAIRVVGMDGIVRAIGSQRGLDIDYVGTSLVKSTLLTRSQLEPSGWYVTGSRRNDGVSRFIYYRVVQDFPLIVTVGLGVNETFKGIAIKQRAYGLIAAVMTLLILLVMALSFRDRTKLERASKQLQLQNLRFDAALNNMSHGLSMVNAENTLVVCNKSYAQMFRLTPEEVRPGTPLERLLEYKAAKGCHAPVTAGKYAHERLSHPSKIEHLPDQRDLLVLSQPMAGGGWVTTYEDVTERLQNEARIAHMARHDALTGLANRVLFLERLEQALACAQQSGERFTIFMLDLDRFKVINDTLGHGAGDALLRTVAHRLQSCAQATDTIARLGGDEFAILQTGDFDQHEGAIAMASRVIESLSRAYHVNGHEAIVGTSIGIAMAPEHGTTTEQLLRNSDLALYQSKLAERNGFCFFEAGMEARASMRSALESDLRFALERDELEIHYQPVVDVATLACLGMEALLRWRRASGEIVYPGDFISIAEDIGLISAIGRWVLDKACNDAMAWPPHIWLAVNLSPVQFGRGDLQEAVIGALADSGLSPHRLELEITESVLLEGSENNLEILGSLKALGAKIVLDDFGTGYSSLSYLSMFAFDKVKIDRSFVSKMIDRPDCAAIVCSIINLAGNLDMTAVAEGVETQEQLIMLRTAGCTEAQGYLFSRPRPASALEFSHRLEAAS